MKKITIIFNIDDKGQAATLINKEGLTDSPEDRLLLLGLLENIKYIENNNLTLSAKVTKRFDKDGMEIN